MAAAPHLPLLAGVFGIDAENADAQTASSHVRQQPTATTVPTPPPPHAAQSPPTLWRTGSAGQQPAAKIPASITATTDAAIEAWDAHAARATAWMRAHPGPTQRIPAFRDPAALGVAVIVEPRRHYLLEFVLRNTAHFLGQHGWAMLVIHGTDNEAYVKGITDGWSGVAFKSIGKANQTAAEYNHTCTTAEFWEYLRLHKRMAIFQTDMLWMRELKPEFLQYDLIGAPWANICFVPGCGHPIFPGHRCCEPKVDDKLLHGLAPNLVGNGGCTIRGVEACLAVCTRCRMDDDTFVAGDDGREVIPGCSSEDVFFATCLPRVGGTVAPRALTSEFGIEQTLPLEITLDTAWAASCHKGYGYWGDKQNVIAAMLSAYTMVDADTGDVFQDVAARRNFKSYM